MSGRVRYDEANVATTHTIKRAASMQLTRSEHQVLLGVIAHTTLCSKLTDRVASTVLADLAGWGGSYKSRSGRVRRNLQSLDAKGLIVYRPGRSIAELPTIGLKPHLHQDAVCDRNPICFEIRTAHETRTKPQALGDGNQGVYQEKISKGGASHRNPEEIDSVDPLVRRLADGWQLPYDETAKTIGRLRTKDRIPDVTLDEVVGFCIEQEPLGLGYVVTIARDWHIQRTGGAA